MKTPQKRVLDVPMDIRTAVAHNFGGGQRGGSPAGKARGGRGTEGSKRGGEKRDSQVVGRRRLREKLRNFAQYFAIE